MEETSQGSGPAGSAHGRGGTGLKSKPGGSEGLCVCIGVGDGGLPLGVLCPRRHQRAKRTFFSSGTQVAACETSTGFFFWEGVLNLNLPWCSYSSLPSVHP